MSALQGPQVVRSLTLSSRTAYERFWVDATGAGPEEFDWSVDEVIGAQPVTGSLPGPLLLWSEPVGSTSEHAEILASYFAGNLDIVRGSREERRFDTRGLTPLRDDEFWPIIDAIGNKVNKGTVSAAANVLARYDEGLILRWQETVAVKAFPLLASFRNSQHAGELGSGVTHMIGSVIGRGRSVYDAVVSDPSTWSEGWITAAANEVMFIGWTALRRNLRKYDVWVTDSFTHTRIGMFHAWTEAMAAWRAAGGPAQYLNELSAATTEPELDEVTAALLAAGPPPDDLSLRAGRALVEQDGRIQMRIVFADVLGNDMEVERQMVSAIESFGGTVCSPVEVNDLAHAGLRTSNVFTIKRTFNGSREQYLTRFTR